MAIPNPAYWYADSVSYAAVTAWANGTAKTVGQIVRQLASPAVGSERVFVCIVAGTTGGSEPSWNLSQGVKTTDNTVTWMEVTGRAAISGSVANTSGWTAGPGGVGTGVKNQAVALGYIIARDNGASFQICTTAGTTGNGSEPSFSNTAGTTTADNSVTWTSLGVVATYGAFQGPYARIQTAANNMATSDVLFVGDDHAETQSSQMVNTFPGTKILPNFIYCVDHTKASPVAGDLKTTAQVITTGASNMFLRGSFYCYGIIFKCASGTNGQSLNQADNGAWQRYDSCSFRLPSTANGSVIRTGNNNTIAIIEWINCTCDFNDTTQLINTLGYWFRWRNTASAVTGAAVPTNLFSTAGGSGMAATIEGVDLSAVPSGKTLVNMGSVGAWYSIINCKLASGVTICSNPTNQGSRCDLIVSDSGATGYRQERHELQGDLATETSITRVSGASDGVQNIAWKIVTASGAKWIDPFESFAISIWNDTTGAPVTATVCINSGGSLNTNEAWIDAEYLGSSATPIASGAGGGTGSPLTAGSAIATDSGSTWNGGLSGSTKQKMQVTFTAQMAGYVRLTVRVAKPSATLYVDPLVTLA